MGVILPATDREGAGQFAADILRMAAQKHLQATVTIQVYPEKPKSSDRSNSTAAFEYDSARWGPDTVSIGYGPQNEDEFVPSMTVPFLGGSISRYKRLGDIVGSALGSLLGAPILALAAIAVKLSSPGPCSLDKNAQGLAVSLYDV